MESFLNEQRNALDKSLRSKSLSGCMITNREFLNIMNSRFEKQREILHKTPDKLSDFKYDNSIIFFNKDKLTNCLEFGKFVDSLKDKRNLIDENPSKWT